MPADTAATPKQSQSRRRRRAVWITIVVVVVIILVLLYLWAKRYVLYTGDAYIEANWVPISAQVQGPVSQVFVTTNDWVEAGAPLFEIDPTPFRLMVERKKGELEEVRKQREQIKEQLDGIAAEIKLQELELAVKRVRLPEAIALKSSDFLLAEDDLDLYLSFQRDETSLAQAQARQKELQATLGPEEPSSENVVAQAELKEAEYNLERTRIVAPVSGWVTDFYLRPGEHVEAGASLFSIVDPSEWWAVARFKDVTLGNIHRGAKAKVWVDMHWNRLFTGYVQGVDAGVNRQQASPQAAPSSLPYVEQTEFWIRLSQRFLVRINIDDPRARDSLKVGANCRVFISRGASDEQPPDAAP